MILLVDTTWGYAMNPQMMILNLQQQKKQTSHVLHLLLSVLTGGLWLVIWLLCGIANASQNSKIDKQIADVNQAIMQQTTARTWPQTEYKG